MFANQSLAELALLVLSPSELYAFFMGGIFSSQFATKNLRRALYLPLLIMLGLAFTNCKVAHKRDELGYDEKPEKPTEVPDELSLKEDRKQFDDLRKDIPEEVKRKNDELAMIMQLLTTERASEAKEEPSRIRDRFEHAVRARRQKFENDMRKTRDEFTKTERKNRDTFLANIKAARDEFTQRKSKKITSDQRRSFFDDQETRRRDFFAEQSEKRRDFESDFNEKRREFEDYMRTRQSDFNQEYRSYTQRYYERERTDALKRRTDEKKKQLEREQQARQEAEEHERAASGGASASPTAGQGVATPPPLEDFSRMNAIPATPLGTSSDGQ